MILTNVVKLYPNVKTRKRLDFYILMRDKYWNISLSKWNDMYDTHSIECHLVKTVFTPQIDKKGNLKYTKKGKAVVKEKNYYSNPSPSYQLIQTEIEQNKSNLDYLVPAHMIRLVVKDLGRAFDAFFDKKRSDVHHPKFKDLNDHVTSSYKDDQACIKNGKLRLTKGILDSNDYSLIRTRPKLPDQPLKLVTIVRKDGNYYAMIAYDEPEKHLMQTGLNDGVDVNVGHFNSCGYRLSILPKRLNYLYKRTNYYQQMLGIKRFRNEDYKKSKRYATIKAHLKRDHVKIVNYQHDIIQKYTTYLVKYHDEIYIEDLDVKHMLMSHVASKGMHRSLFGYFRQVLTYKCKLYRRKLHIVNRFFPSTQMCPNCGYIKTGDDRITLHGNRKYGTKHNEFHCNECGYTADRDAKVPATLMRYSDYTMKHIRKLQHKQATVINGLA